MDEKMSEKAFELILHAGNSRSSSMEALMLARKGQYEEAQKKFEDADKEFHLAHEVQTSMLFANAQGAETKPDILMVHAQDHFTMAMVCFDLCKEMVNMYQEMREHK